MYRFRELTPVDDSEALVTLGEGGTPLLELPRLAAHLGIKKLWAKDDGQNPTGSFKARGLGMAVTRARTLGAAVLRPLQGIGQPRPVTGGHHGGRCRSRACCQVRRTFLHDELRAGRPQEGTTEEGTGVRGPPLEYSRIKPTASKAVHDV
jgi:hypothetical protein